MKNKKQTNNMHILKTQNKKPSLRDNENPKYKRTLVKTDLRAEDISYLFANTGHKIKNQIVGTKIKPTFS